MQISKFAIARMLWLFAAVAALLWALWKLKAGAESSSIEFEIGPAHLVLMSALSFPLGPAILFVLRHVEITREFMTAAARWTMALKLWSVLSARMAISLNPLSLQKKFSIQCRPLHVRQYGHT